MQPEICAAFWTWKNLNVKADAGDFDGLVKIWNGGTNGLADRKYLMAGNDPIIRKLATVNDLAPIVQTLPPLKPAAPPVDAPATPGFWANLTSFLQGKHNVLFAIAQFAVVLLWYTLSGRAWLKSKSWARGFFAWIEPIEIFLFKKSETILVSRLLWVGSLFVTFYDSICHLRGRA